jgi:hypothetical protein
MTFPFKVVASMRGISGVAVGAGAVGVEGPREKVGEGGGVAAGDPHPASRRAIKTRLHVNVGRVMAILTILSRCPQTGGFPGRWRGCGQPSSCAASAT